MKTLSQKKYHYTFSPFHEPMLRIEPGETVKVGTIDAASRKVKTEKDKLPSRWNPLSGPVFIEGASEGDALVIKIDDIKITEEKGVSAFLNDVDPLSEMLLNPKAEPRIISVKKGKAYLENIELPINPSIGCLGTAPKDEAISSELSGRYGGNLDVPDIRVGTRLFLPVNVDGALLFVGDVHAIQAEGELFCIDISAECTLTIDLMKRKQINLPRLDLPEYIMAIGVSGDIKDALYSAYREMVLWIEEEYDLERWDAYRLCTEVAVIKAAKILRPQAVIGLKFPKKYLPKR